MSEHEPCSRSRREGTLNRHATIAKIQRQRYKESEKLGKRRPSKQRANKQPSFETRESKPRPQRKYKARRKSIATQSSDMSTIKIGAFPLATEAPRQDNGSANHLTSELDISPPTPRETPLSEKLDTTNRPNDSPRSRRERQNRRSEPPITRSKARITPQGHTDLQDSHAPLQRNTSDSI